MYARTSYSADDLPSFIVSDNESEFSSAEFYAGDPVCPPSRRKLEVVPYSTLFLLLALTVGIAFATDDATRALWTEKFEHIASTVMARVQSAQSTEPLAEKAVASADVPGSIPLPSPTPPATAAIAQPLPEVTVANAPGVKDDADADKTSGKASVSDAYAPPAPSNDPYRRKAESVGLHPDLSRVVLARLTPADYRNAAYAIQKAIKSVPDDGEFTWPRTRAKGTAVFSVHFVPGAERDCRRYVVTITKDRWTSTALPMEKCGVKVAFRTADKEKSVE
ncbi:MAG: hypothetical protein QM780_16745 [Hyphomicrobium sp.]|uniref:hypothetical protein n=1 Tax=Hyphomicrobium sp. TaxID=82 RepID=UPI0039E29885